MFRSDPARRQTRIHEVPELVLAHREREEAVPVLRLEPVERRPRGGLRGRAPVLQTGAAAGRGQEQQGGRQLDAKLVQPVHHSSPTSQAPMKLTGSKKPSFGGMAAPMSAGELSTGQTASASSPGR